MNSEPVLTMASVQAIATAIVAALAHFGILADPATIAAILVGVIAVVALITRGKVYSPATVERLTKGGSK